jgi:phospholipid transport system substrate-binding protein
VARSFIATLSLALTLFATAAQAADPPSAQEAFESSHASVLKLVHDKVGNDKIEKEVDNFLDYKWIAEAALSGKKKCEPRCDEYEALLARLIRQNYLKRINQSDTGSMTTTGAETRGKKAKVDTLVKFNKDGEDQELQISYVMHFVDDKWVCRNIITDGVSLARTYKYEFNKIIRDEGIDGLIARLENKLAEVAKG